MGDRSRGKIVAEYIRRNFPNVKVILAVADGNLILSRELTSYKVTAIDPIIRNRFVASNLTKIKRFFYAQDQYKCDLIVGLHPDQATGEIVDFSILNRVPCIIVPCCVVGRYSTFAPTIASVWAKHLSNILLRANFSVELDLLSFKGANVVIKAIPL